MRRPVVLFLTNAPAARTPIDRDVEPRPFLLRDGLIAAGFDVRQRQLNGVPLNPLARRGTFFAGFDVVRALVVLLRDRDVDVVVSVGESNLVVILLLAKLLRFKPPIALREISGRGWAKRDRVVDFVVPRVDRLLLLTPRQAIWAATLFRLKSPPDMVGFAIDERFFRQQALPEDGYVLAVGDDVGRDYACLIEACRELPYKLVLRTNSNLVIPEDMRERVSVMGRQSFAALRDLYAGAAIVVLPLHPVEHPSGITTLFEAMASGRAVVASNVGTIGGVLQHGVAGLVVPPGDAEALRGAIAALMADSGMRRHMGDQARRVIEEQNSYPAYVARVVAALRSIITSRRG